MKIYTGQHTGEKLQRIIELGMGVMISSSPVTKPVKEVSKTYCALDNGAYSCYSKGYPFMKEIFLKTLQSVYQKNIALDFIVTPDIIAKGMESFLYSFGWATSEPLKTAPNLALVVQDGITPRDLGSIRRWSHIFVGGTVEWKWKTAKEWVDFGHAEGKQVHIGQAGKLEYLLRAYEIGADSVDSTSWTRNDSFHIVEQFYDQIGKKPERHQLTLFSEVNEV